MDVCNNINDLKPLKIVKVAINGAAYYFDKLYDYIVPVEFENDIFIGQRVVVPFGKGNKKKVGLILNIESYTNRDKLPYFVSNGLAIKPIIQIIDNREIINDEMVKIILWLKKNTFCRYFDAVKVVLPSGYNVSLFTKYRIVKEIDNSVYDNLSEEEKMILNIFKLDSIEKNKKHIIMFEDLTKSQRKILKDLIDKKLIIERDVLKKKIQDEKLLMVRLNTKVDKFIDDISSNYKFTQKQKKVINLLKESEAASIKEVIYMCGVTRSVLDNLNKKGLIEYFEVEVYRRPYELKDNNDNRKINLNNDQKCVFDKLVNLIEQNKPNIALIRGVTGSGKTLIFINLIKHVIAKGLNVILLVPEISLIPQTIKILEKYFGDSIAILHSGLTLSNRLDEWKRVKSGEAKIVLGTRSAIFAPLNDIGLIIMDEEQESSYKSESAPRYHARDIAKIRTFYNNSLLLMASATPSIETYYYMKKNQFDILKLDRRYNDIKLPHISIVDMKKEKQKGNNSFFSEELVLSLEDNISKNQQSIIFINRRGYNTIIKCEICGNVEMCPNCSIALTYHKTNNRLICHYCGYSKDVVKKCSNCGSVYIKYDGVGTQKIESQLENILPMARILRLDSDTTMTRFSCDNYFQDFLSGKYDILIGTQMIAKGLNFPNVTLVGVVDADRSIYSNDYRGVERTYDIITQVIGRSGRGDVEGKAVIQTELIDNNIFDLIINQRYEDFYSREILIRKELMYPPFCDILVINLIGSNEDIVIKIGNEIFNLIKYLISNDYRNVKINMFGPISDVISRINNKYRYKIFIKHKNDKKFRQLINFVLIKVSREKCKYGVNIFVNKI